MTIEELRAQIDAADEQLLAAFSKRMEIAGKIADYKREKGLPVLDSSRERQKLADVVDRAQAPVKPYVGALYHLLFELSRLYQGEKLRQESALVQKVQKAVGQSDALFPPEAIVACQGVEGAYSQIACEKLFKVPNIMYFKSFDAVFAAIDKGLCRYGVLPVENSTAGSVNRIYDLMMRYDFSIVRSTRLKINHNLLAKPGTALDDVREVYSHPQALSQCAGYLATLKNVKITPCENTAVAALQVAQSQRGDVAALASMPCAALYGLQCLQTDVQDQDSNYTRFICISKNLEIYPGADRTSLMMVLPHRPGSLYQVLSRFYALGINLLKLESRPLPGRDFEFMFYFDLETSIYSPEFIRMLSEIEQMAQQMRYLGSYSEVV